MCVLLNKSTSSTYCSINLWLNNMQEKKATCNSAPIFKKRDKSASYSLAWNPNSLSNSPTKTSNPDPLMGQQRVVAWVLKLLISDYVKVWFCHSLLPTLAQNTNNANASFKYKSRSVWKPSLPVLFTDICVGAVGRENNWVIVPTDNYEDFIYNGAYCIQELLKVDLHIEAFW